MAVMFHGFTVKVDGRTKDAENTSFICGGQSVNVFFMAVMSDGFEVKVDGRMGIEASLDLCCSSWDGGHSCHVKPELKGVFVFFSHFVFLSLWFCICWCGVRRPKLAAGRSSRG